MLWCLVYEPNGIIHEFYLKKDTKGGECLDKICERLKLYERDYFGLRYKGYKGTEIWLNLRNPLSPQLHGKPPYRIWFLVKYFVKPQELQQEITRHQYFLTSKLYLRRGQFDLSTLPTKTVAVVCATLAQAETGDYNADNVPDYFSYLPLNVWSAQAKSCNLKKEVSNEHNKLAGQSAPVAEVNFLHQVSVIHGYGIETFKGRYTADSYGRNLKILVDSGGLKVYSIIQEYDAKLGKDVVRSVLDRRIHYEDVSTVSYSGRNFTVSYSSGVSATNRVVFKLKSELLAISLFRSFTEFHTFFNSSTVKKSVIDQTTRTSFGKFMTFFRPRSRIGEMHLFDILRTRRQAYTHSWSILNEQLNINNRRKQQQVHNSHVFRPVQSPITNRRSGSDDDDTVIDISKSSAQGKFTVHENLNELSNDELKSIVRSLEDSRICQVCMDEEVATAFCPCGHIVCCKDCSVMCRECPICRSQITYAQRVFFSCD